MRTVTLLSFLEFTLLLLVPDHSISISVGDISPFAFPPIIMSSQSILDHFPSTSLNHRDYVLLIISPFLSKMSNPSHGVTFSYPFSISCSRLILIIPITCNTGYLRTNKQTNKTIYLNFSFGLSVSHLLLVSSQ